LGLNTVPFSVISPEELTRNLPAGEGVLLPDQSTLPPDEEDEVLVLLLEEEVLPVLPLLELEVRPEELLLEDELLLDDEELLLELDDELLDDELLEVFPPQAASASANTQEPDSLNKFN
jgi:hypothetical protein